MKNKTKVKLYDRLWQDHRPIVQLVIDQSLEWDKSQKDELLEVCSEEIVNKGWCCLSGRNCNNHYTCDICGKLHYTDFLLQRLQKEKENSECGSNIEFTAVIGTNNDNILHTPTKKTIKTTLIVYDKDPEKHIKYHIEAATMKELSALENDIINYHNNKIVAYEGGEVV